MGLGNKKLEKNNISSPCQNLLNFAVSPQSLTFCSFQPSAELQS